MNHTLKIKLAAFVASTAGFAFGPTLESGAAIQSPNGRASAGTSMMLQPRFGNESPREMPPIVKNGKQGNLSTPPIVSGGQGTAQNASGMLAPIVKAPPIVKRAMPWKVDTQKYQQAIDSGNAGDYQIGATSEVASKPATSPVPTESLTGNGANVIDAAAEIVESEANNIQQAAAQFAGRTRGRLTSAFSSAGVPIYAQQGSDTQVPVGSGLAEGDILTATPQMDFNAVSVPNTTPQLPASGDMVTPYNGDMSSAMVTDAAVESTTTDPTWIQATPADAPVVATSDCGCGVAGAVGCAPGQGCNCGPDGCFNANDVALQFGNSGSISNARQYAHLEAMLLSRADGDISVGTGNSLGNFDFDGGWRLTFGVREDAILGRELSYMGSLPIDESSTAIEPAGRARLSAGFIPTGGFDDFANGVGNAETSAFFNGVSQTQEKETYFHSLEFNQVRWAWDVLKTFFGVRYIYFNDEYTLNSTNAFGETGEFKMKAFNNLFGVHVGEEIFYDVGYRLSFSLFGKAGIFGNANQMDTRLSNDGRLGNLFQENTDEGGAFSTMLEAGLVAHYQVSPRGRLRLSYNGLLLSDVVTVSDNLSPVVVTAPGRTGRLISPNTGSSVSDDDDAVFHGLGFGFEIFR